MSLRLRTAIATSVSVALIMAMLLLAYRFTLLEAYRDLDRAQTSEEFERTVSVLHSEERALDVLLTDWASWDDMYSFVETHSPAFVSSNLPPEILGQLNLNVLVIRDAAGRNVIGIGRDGEGRSAPMPGLTDAIPASSPLLVPAAEGHVTGLIGSPAGPMLISARPILMSDGKGQSRGMVVMARLLDQAYTDRLAEMLGIGVTAFPPGSDEVPAALAHDSSVVVSDGPEGRLAAFGLLRDIGGEPVLVLRVDRDRMIEAQSGKTLGIVLGTVAMTGALLVILLTAAIDMTVVRRLRQLLTEMQAIAGRGRSTGSRARVSGADEIGDLATGFNAMLDRLELATTEELRLRETVTQQERLAEEAFRGLHEGLVVVDASDRCRVANPAALEILALEGAQVVGQPLASLLPPLLPADDLSRSAGPEYFERDGRTVAVSRSEVDMPDHFSVITLRDITETRAVERLKRDLVATVSHELRTPLTAIHATARMLASEEGRAVQERLIELLNRNADRLLLLINDLLDMSALEGRRVTLQRVQLDLAELCAEVVDEMREPADQAGVTIREDLEAAVVHVDERRIRQVIENLIQNAVKFTPSGGSVEIGTRLLDHRATITVHDTGIGIPPADLERVFEKFYRTTDGARFTRGTGLGLAIARSIVDLHGGRVRAESDGASGTTVTVELPDDIPVQ